MTRNVTESGFAMEQKGTDSVEDTGTAQEDVVKAHGHVSKKHDVGLLAIGLFKLVEAVFFFLVGIGVIHFIHRDLGEAAVRLAYRLRVDPDGRLVLWVVDHLDAITAHRLKQIGVATFFYAGLRLTEGVGLILEKTWAEYMTLGVTASFLPWELYEIARRPDWIRIGLLVTNVLVLAYLVWWLRRAQRTGEIPLL